MYISIERNSRGNLDIDEKILSKIIEFDFSSNATGFRKVKASVSIHQETNLFIVIRIYIIEKGLFLMDGLKVTSIINDSIYKTLRIRPKNIAFAFIK
ncbi:MMB_0454 family protein [Spiroplasma diminutum]|uniref:Uncharacterized protein n=1 Tax=Spiroplasma diminutum CUAS-1 TaxID=1276221 RepID=S5MJ72_9MOLU|nr:hypothetical protein [Spiroplasma diminutum]AGR42010.1 hypothetical protein SDIMI_v3c03060 [Spiroplasma diminutum CUAS-1]